MAKMKNKRIRVSLDVAQRGGGGFGKDTSLGIFFRGEHPDDTKEFDTTHKLAFESRPWFRNQAIQEFRVGTCIGQWFSEGPCYYILSVINEDPGNGHLDDVFQWFERSCQRDGKALVVLELMNITFWHHLIDKRGFQPIGQHDLIKHFKAA